MTQRSTISIVHGESRNGQVGSTVDAHQLYGRVLECESSYGRASETVGVKELWLRLSTIATLSIPPSGTISINDWF
jgi:hypothetical protein